MKSTDLKLNGSLAAGTRTFKESIRGSAGLIFVD